MRSNKDRQHNPLSGSALGELAWLEAQRGRRAQPLPAASDRRQAAAVRYTAVRVRPRLWLLI